MSVTAPNTKASNISEQLTESIQQSLLDHGVNKARVTLELLGKKAKSPHHSASGANTTKTDENNVEVIILNHDESEEVDENEGSTSFEKEVNCNSKAFMYSSEVIGTDKDQIFSQNIGIKNSSPMCFSVSVNATEGTIEKDRISEQLGTYSTELTDQDESTVSAQPRESCEGVASPKAASPLKEGKAVDERTASTAAAEADPMTLESMAMMMDEDLIPDDMKKMIEREKNKKERIRILNTFVGKSVLLDQAKAQGPRKASPLPPVSMPPFMAAAVRAQERRAVSAGQRRGPEAVTETPQPSASGIQVLRFTLPSDDRARLDAVEQLSGSATGKQHVSGKDKYRLMMSDQQETLKWNSTSQDEYKQLLDKAIEYNRYLLE